jgi:lysophospholipase L1-like esterase
VVLALLVLEGLLRIFAPQIPGRLVRRPHPKGMYTAHPVLGHILTPGWRGVFRRPGMEMEVRVNRIGLRDRERGPKDPGTTRILILGDSFTFGWGVPYEEAYGPQTERLLRKRLGREVEVIPAGIPGYDTETELAWLETFGWDLEPDLVVLQFCASNDFADNLLPPFEVKDGFLHRPSRRRAVGAAYRSRGAVVDWLERHSHLWVFLSRRYRSFGRRDRRALKERQVRNLNREYRLAYEKTAQLLERMAEACRAHGVPLVVFNAAVKYQVEDADLVERDLLLEPDRFLERTCARLGIPLVDTVPAFLQDDGGLFLEKDAHWSVRGHALAARILADALAPLLEETGGGAAGQP